MVRAVARRSPRPIGVLVLALVVWLAVGAAVRPGEARAIIGGDVRQAAETPWLVQVRQGGRQVCTGTLVEPRLVLTAAHCLTGGLPTSIAAGRQTTRGADGQVVPIGRYSLNAAWASRQRGSRVSSRGDVALLELRRPVVGVAPIALGGAESRSFLRAGRTATAAGWGLTAGPARSDRTLRAVSLRVRSAGLCGRAVSVSGTGDRPPSVLCAGTPRSRGVCSGDSGGPLYGVTPAGPVQLGVLSAVVTTQGRRERRVNCGRFLLAVYVPTLSGSARRWIDRTVARSLRTRPADSRAGVATPRRIAG